MAEVENEALDRADLNQQVGEAERGEERDHAQARVGGARLRREAETEHRQQDQERGRDQRLHEQRREDVEADRLAARQRCVAVLALRREREVVPRVEVEEERLVVRRRMRAVLVAVVERLLRFGALRCGIEQLAVLVVLALEARGVVEDVVGLRRVERRQVGLDLRDVLLREGRLAHQHRRVAHRVLVVARHALLELGEVLDVLETLRALQLLGEVHHLAVFLVDDQEVLARVRDAELAQRARSSRDEFEFFARRLESEADHRDHAVIRHVREEVVERFDRVEVALAEDVAARRQS